MKKTQAVTALNLTMRFGNRTVFEGVNFSVQPGESMALIGPSGSGKSTILSCILGLQTPTRGQVWVGGKQHRGTKPKTAGANSSNPDWHGVSAQ
jgi:ABC-type sugar transport system ATPase subunit